MTPPPSRGASALSQARSFTKRPKNTDPLWHFNFHRQSDIAESLVAGRERLYIKHFYDRLAQNPSAFTNAGIDFYADQYSQPGAMRCAFTTYRMFERDAEMNRKWAEEKSKVRNLVLNGAQSFLALEQGAMAAEVLEEPSEATVEGSGHWIAEENPEGFVREILRFIEA